MMSQSYSNSDLPNIINAKVVDPPTIPGPVRRKWGMILGLTALVFVGFFASEAIVYYGAILLKKLGVSFNLINESILSTIFSVVIYLLAIVIIIGIPWLVKKYKTTIEELGFLRLPSWMDILITPAGLIVYVISSAIISLIFFKIFPGMNINQAQEVGFSDLTQKYQYILAFITLVIVTPIAEETLFRGYLFGKLKKYHIPVWIAMIVTSVLFGAIHGQWNLAIDTFVLSMVMCLLRQITGNLWAPILLHMVKNGIAYYILFINPLFLTTLGS